MKRKMKLEIFINKKKMILASHYKLDFFFCIFFFFQKHGHVIRFDYNCQVSKQKLVNTYNKHLMKYGSIKMRPKMYLELKIEKVLHT